MRPQSLHFFHAAAQVLGSICLTPAPPSVDCFTPLCNFPSTEAGFESYACSLTFRHSHFTRPDRPLRAASGLPFAGAGFNINKPSAGRLCASIGPSHLTFRRGLESTFELG
ncbi:unnamed protein product [Protopolystoma xenopodis]|uniref:Uncharacterized protein n=1 Tax=Protopolystoma xenopodis TaxID=117903 RepID=A0A448XJ40_9PLAT|nr:unnamed protein product [Protopolystoma xenopodis]